MNSVQNLTTQIAVYPIGSSHLRQPQAYPTGVGGLFQSAPEINYQITVRHLPSPRPSECNLLMLVDEIVHSLPDHALSSGAEDHDPVSCVRRLRGPRLGQRVLPGRWRRSHPLSVINRTLVAIGLPGLERIHLALRRKQQYSPGETADIAIGGERVGNYLRS